MHEQMSRLGGQFEARPPVFKTPSKLSTQLSINCSRDESLRESCSCKAWNRSRACSVEARYATIGPLYFPKLTN
ncbi:hypothetical protein TNCV_2348361 [Trichonephila clavipes]|uniref:Uncharacterized protein n=1 Tax=Trichonephila clavipes TaxID=2585209 RepID=A0A8X6SXK6_TRICX|nr:hypothetical protein TNCV_2348361 [Trichonephila clavipes]